MQNAISTIEKNNALAIYLNPFDLWSDALTSVQFYASGVSGQQITNSVLALDPVLNVPNIANNYSNCYAIKCVL